MDFDMGARQFLELTPCRNQEITALNTHSDIMPLTQSRFLTTVKIQNISLTLNTIVK
jgi:hypothetical protein